MYRVSWFIDRDWWKLSRDKRKLALAESYPLMFERHEDNTVGRALWFDAHRWNGTAGMALGALEGVKWTREHIDAFFLAAPAVPLFDLMRPKADIATTIRFSANVPRAREEVVEITWSRMIVMED